MDKTVWEKFKLLDLEIEDSSLSYLTLPLLWRGRQKASWKLYHHLMHSMINQQIKSRYNKERGQKHSKFIQVQKTMVNGFPNVINSMINLLAFLPKGLERVIFR